MAMIVAGSECKWAGGYRRKYTDTKSTYTKQLQAYNLYKRGTALQLYMMQTPAGPREKGESTKKYLTFTQNRV